jgi:hypothetical protein
MRLSLSTAGAAKGKRVAALISLLAIFFLPLHSHANLGTAQVSKECACVHGSRSEMGAPPAAISPDPLFIEFFHDSLEPLVLSYETLSFRSIRAPPAS